MKTEKELRKTLGENAQQLRSMYQTALREQRELTADESNRFDKLIDECDAIRSQLGERAFAKLENRAKTLDAIEQELERPINPFKPDDFGGTSHTETWRDLATGREVRVLGIKDSMSRMLRAEGNKDPELGLGDFIRAYDLGPRNDVEKRALAEATAGAGGATVPLMLSAELIDRMRAASTVFQYGARTIQMTSQKLDIARVTTDPTPGWRDEAGAVSDQDVVFEKLTLTARSLAFVVKASRELLEDTTNLNEELPALFARVTAGEVDRVALFGTGAAPVPCGIRNAANVCEKSMGTNGAAITNYDPVLDNLQSLLEANAPMPVVAVMAPRTYITLAKFKEATTNAPLAKPPVLSYPFVASSRMPITETQGTSNVASSIIQGFFPDLYVGIRAEFQVQKLVERYADVGQHAFLVWARLDIALRHPQSFGRIIGIIP
jgi:HK97 family phage major capsid protein